MFGINSGPLITQLRSLSREVFWIECLDIYQDAQIIGRVESPFRRGANCPHSLVRIGGQEIYQSLDKGWAT